MRDYMDRVRAWLRGDGAATVPDDLSGQERQALFGGPPPEDAA